MSKAYVKDIKANSAQGEHQTSPGWMLTFVRWQNRSPIDFGPNEALAVRDPLVVESDCRSLNISQDKSSHTPHLSAILFPGDINYEAAVAPGDFVFANVVDNIAHIHDDIAPRARKGDAINHEHDGFKGLFRVQSVRRTIMVDPDAGHKRMVYKIEAYGFTELNNTIYFNPFLLTDAEKQNDFLFITRIGDEWNQNVGSKINANVQSVVKMLWACFVGNGVSQEGQKIKEELIRSPNVHFYIPKLVGKLLGAKNAQSARDIYNLLFGVQQYGSGAQQSLGAGMNPRIAKRDGRFMETAEPCTGTAYIKAEYWNQIKAWDILHQYINSPFNEMYTCYRVSPEGSVMPTVVFRQLPFSSEKMKNNNPLTRFLNLPRWRVSPDLIFDVDLGRDDAARLNFVQVFGRCTQLTGAAQQAAISQQIAAKNYRYDIDDVKRSGLKPYVISSNFDYPKETKKKTVFYASDLWTPMMADILIGGHLKLNGSITCAGIEEPIAIGDNLELDSVVFHIESLTHSCQIEAGGRKSFKTTIQLSHGVDLRSGSKGTVYADMDNPDGLAESIRDFAAERMQPGVTFAQDTPGMTAEGSEPKPATNRGFNPDGTAKPKKGQA